MRGLPQQLHSVYTNGYFRHFIREMSVDPSRACFSSFAENYQSVTKRHATYDDDARSSLLWELHLLYEFFEHLVIAMSPLTLQQAAALFYTDARLVWLYDHAVELEKLLQLAVCFCKAGAEPVPVAVSMCAAWLTTCKQTSFLQVAKAKRVEWDFALESQFAFYEVLASAPPAGAQKRT